MLSKSSTLEDVERQELIQKLINGGYRKLVEALLENENKCYTKKHRLNKSGACRVLGWKTKQLEDALIACREMLNNDMGQDEE